MKTHLFAVLCTTALAFPAFAALKAGDTAPDFEARASLAGEEFDFSLANALEKGTVVVYFYPSAYTQGCNVQAREFAVNMDKFEAAGASVIGVSLDSIERLNDFSADPEYCAGKLAVASDEDGEIAKSYELDVQAGVAEPAAENRWPRQTFGPFIREQRHFHASGRRKFRLYS